MPRKIGTENWRKKRRQEHLEMKEYRYYIFCEGEQTEPRYFSGFKKLIEDNPIYRDMVLIQIEPCGAETIGRLFAAKIGARGEKDNILLGRTVGEADKNEDEYAEKNQLVLSADLYEKLKQNDSGLSSLFKKKNGGVYYTESGYRGYLSQESRKQLKHDNAYNNYNKAWGYSLTEIESERKYVKDVFADIQQARETYPFIEATLLPTVDPVPIQLKVAAVNKSLLERTHAKREDFAGPYSRELEIIVPFDYKKAGCKVYGGKWIDTKLVKEEYQHFNDKRKDGCYLFCVGVPESFPQMENVILENIRTAEKIDRKSVV